MSGLRPMREIPLAVQRKVMAFAAFLEVATGLALIVDPLVASFLTGPELAGAGTTISRLVGIALLALGAAWWPHGDHAGHLHRPTVRSMLGYNVLVVLYLAYLGLTGRWQGALLWPAAAIHAFVGLSLIWTWRAGLREERRGS